MKPASAPNREQEQPATIECAGAELPAKPAELKVRGAVVTTMTATDQSRRRLSSFNRQPKEFRDATKSGKNHRQARFDIEPPSRDD